MVTLHFSLSHTLKRKRSKSKQRTAFFFFLNHKTRNQWWKGKKLKKTRRSRQLRVLSVHLLEVGYFGGCIGIQLDLRWAHLLGLLFWGETKDPACPQSKGYMQATSCIQAMASAGYGGSVVTGGWVSGKQVSFRQSQIKYNTTPSGMTVVNRKAMAPLINCHHVYTVWKASTVLNKA